MLYRDLNGDCSTSFNPAGDTPDLDAVLPGLVAGPTATELPFVAALNFAQADGVMVACNFGDPYQRCYTKRFQVDDGWTAGAKVREPLLFFLY